MAGKFPERGNRGGPSAKFGGALLTGPTFAADTPTLLDGLSGGPDNITNLWAWWDATTLGLNNNDIINSVPDSSGNGRAISKVGSPIFKTNQINGLGAAHNNNATGNWFAITLQTLPLPYTIMVVAYSAAASVDRYMVTKNGSSPFVGLSATNGYVKVDAGPTVTASTGRFGTWTGYIASFSSSNIKIYDRATTPAAIGAAATQAWSNENILIWQNTSQTQYFAEIAIFNKELNSSEIAALGLYINGKYGLSWGG